MRDATWKLEELAEEAGVSARTIRYYVQRGLLAPPVFRGKDSAYGREHLLRLRAVKVLQDRHLPLDEIQRVLDTRTLGELERLADGRDLPLAPAPEPVVHTRVEPVRAVTWRRIELAPGLELNVSEEAPASVRALAREIEERFGKAR